MWRLRCALEIGGVKVHRQRRNFKLNGEWEMLIAPPSRRDRDEVHRFAGWCSIREILRRLACRLDRNYTYLEEQMFDPSVRTKLLNLPLDRKSTRLNSSH